MRRGELARRTGVHPETIRFYEARGIIPAPRRLANGYRDYDEQHVRLLRRAAAARRLGLPLAALDPAPESAATLRELLAARLSASEHALRRLARERADLRELLAAETARYGV
ncbi:MerR family transcriptional regulator [Mycetocola spongiae]|uniref:MerR family transcriptional regulator n=1 Tax=Mycetocola spongiae TaxID=2859226 RepID=UPI001CF2BA92|nr:MerR family transcriptional regulator [Mycetocola spongiae]UCR88845.1 MerR family DNA-binding transcriptional regulator [Mycetocola spongiae]